MKKTSFILIIFLLPIICFGQENKDIEDEFVFQYLKTDNYQKGLISEIELNYRDNKELINIVDSIDIALTNLYKIKDMSSMFDDIYSKTCKKISRLKQMKYSYLYEIEYNKEINYNTAYQIYKTHLSSHKLKKTANKKEVQQLLKEVEKYAKNTNLILDSLENSHQSIEEEIKMLERANNLAQESIRNQEKALSLYYNFKLNKDYNNNKYLIVKNENPKDIKQNNINKPVKLQKADSNNIIINKINVKNNLMTFKIQIGAFVGDIDTNEFSNIKDCLSIDDIDEKPLTKYMVGKFYSLNEAKEYKEKIITDTNFKDAFVVAYIGEKRVPINNTVLYTKNDLTTRQSKIITLQAENNK